jgi:hypothetical protein
MPEEPVVHAQVEIAMKREAWRKSEARRRTFIIYAALAGTGLLCDLMVFLLYGVNGEDNAYPIIYDKKYYIASGVFIAVVVLIIGQAEYVRRRREFEDSRLLELYGDLSEEEGRLLDEENLRLGTLWNLTQDRLKVYHEIATRQANASFRNAQYAITGGFAVVIVSAFAAFLAKNATASIVAGTLGTVGAALSAYIGKTFLRLQESAASHLRSYFDQPQEQFRYLSAERLLKSLDTSEQKSAAVAELMRSIVSNQK